jgi:hypothetical protein
MQNQMSDKNRAALLEYGPREILSELANMPSLRKPSWEVKAKEFVERNGQLLPHAQGSVLEGSEIAEYGKRFRLAWEAKRNAELIPVVNSHLNEIFAASGPKTTPPYKGDPAVFSADFQTGRWTPRPRTLLDALAIELMRSRKMLYQCEQLDCQRYFVKRYSREKYCKMTCGEKGRASSLERYHEKHREQRNAGRRKPRK